MMKDLSIIAQASAMARHAAERHRVIAENVANADTPQFKAKDLPEFDPALATQDASGFARIMRPSPIQGLEASPNGNNVSVEDQMTRAVEAQAEHEAAMRIYQKSMELLRMSLSGRR